MEERRVLVVALGTRGDVAPLLALANRLKADGCAITIVTHAAHQHSLDWSGIECIRVPTDPSRRADAHGRTGDGGGSELAAEYAPVLALVRSARSRPDLILFNLFALGVWHIADAFGIRCAAASPCLIPYAHPADFEDRFKAAHPALHRALGGAGESQVGWEEVLHWMWPLWTERWATWRRETLQAPEVPLVRVTSPSQLPPPTPLLYGFSPILVPPPPYWPASVRTTGFWHADLGVGELNRRDQYGADAPTALQVAVAGGRDATAWRHVIATLRRHGGDCAPIYVGFGSASAHYIAEAAGSIGALVTAAAEVQSRGREVRSRCRTADGRTPLILHACGCASIADAWASAIGEFVPALGDFEPDGAVSCAEVKGVTIVLVRGCLPLAALLPHCHVAVHHGGAGTCAAAAIARTPQLVLPRLFDQVGS